MTVFPKFHRFWDFLWSEIGWDSLYIVNIGDMRLRLPKLEDKDEKAKSLRATDFSEDWENIKEVFQYRDLPYVPEIICFGVINCHHNDLFAGHFGIDKIPELVARKYY